MLIIGLTGGIASGKSLVARIFRDLGAHIIDADRIVHELLEPGQSAWKEVVGFFGSDVLLADKSLDRKKIGEIVFNDPEKRAWLNGCLHPKVFAVYHKQIKRLARVAPDAVVVFDAALLIETGFHKKVDRTVVVYAEPDQQLARLMERDAISREQALARMNSQMPLSEKRLLADHVIDNTGTRQETERRARAVFETLKQQAQER